MTVVALVDTNPLGQSFASLVKNNNGMFKSEKQAKFLLSQMGSDGSYTGTGHTWASYAMSYFCDQKGVTKVVKYTKATGDKVMWTRKVEGEVSVQDSKEIKRLTRLIKSTAKSVEGRQKSLDSGEYVKAFESDEAAMACFNVMQRAEQLYVFKLAAKLADVKDGNVKPWAFYDNLSL